MLQAWDDLPLHQAPSTLDQPATNDPDCYERYFFSAFAPAGEAMFGLVVNVHPNKGTADAALTVSADNVHHSLFVTDRLLGQRTPLRCGPLTMDFREPMRRLHLQLAPTSGFAVDLSFTAVAPPVAEDRVTRSRGNKVVQDRSRYVQWGRLEGSLTGPNGSWTTGPAGWPAGRDHSWGIWDAGAAQASAQRSHSPSFLWLIGAFEDTAVQAVTHTDPEGTAYGHYASCVPTFSALATRDAPADNAPTDEPALAGPETLSTKDVSFSPSSQPGTRHLAGGEMSLDMPGWHEGVGFTSLHVLLPRAIGYDHPTRYFGAEVPSLPYCTTETVELREEDLLAPDNHRSIQAVRLTRDDGAVGYGLIDQRVGPWTSPSEHRKTF